MCIVSHSCGTNDFLKEKEMQDYSCVWFMVNQNCLIVEAKLFLTQPSLSLSDPNVYKLCEEHAVKI